MERGDELFPVEMKSGRTVVSDSFTGLKFWLALPGNPQEHGTLVYGGDRAFARNGSHVQLWFA